MTALPLTQVQSSCPGKQRAEKALQSSSPESDRGMKSEKGVQFLSTCRLCGESYKSQVWLRFLFLSFLGAYTCAPSVPGTADVQICLKMLRHAIEKSDAMLYGPSTNEVEEECKIMSLKCYILELNMVIDEEEIMDNIYADCITDFDSTLPETNPVGCPPCEAYSLKNITVFLESLNTLLEEMTVRWKMHIM